jgi:ribosomal protein L11 methyltransferase
MSASQFWELSVSAPEDISEGLTNFVWELGALGVFEEEVGGAARLRAFFPASLSAAGLDTEVRDYLGGLRALGFRVIDDTRIAAVADPGWAEAWRTHFQPLCVGNRLLVVPPWETWRAEGRLVIVIEPGRAFGTGHHGSTAGCLEMLERVIEDERPARALDLGTGSGILAIAAARLGVARVRAIDHDPEAVANALANVARNDVATSVMCTLGDVAALEAEPTPIVFANILAAAHTRLAAIYQRLVAPGGVLVLGGLLEGEVGGAAEVMSRRGFDRRATLVREGWGALELIQRG